MADKKKMSVEDILAACRGSDAGAASSPTEPASQPTAKEEVAEAATPQPTGGGPAAGGQAASGKSSKEMSVADILAAARGQGGGSTAKPTPKPKATPSKAPKPAAGKTAEKATPARPAAPMDTSSILAAARQGTKPGPVTKTQAAAKASGTSAATPKRVAPPMPAKPAYAVPKAKAVEKDDRRGFFSLLLGSFMALGFTAMGLTGTLWTLGFARFMFPNILIEPPSRFKVGFPSDFSPGSVETKFKAQFGVWIVNTEYEGQLEIVALKTVCTHLGCTPNWLEAEQKFKCPCHGSGFYKDGINFEGPAPRPLERYSIRLAEDGQLEIDKSKTFQQEMGQWSEPASFVTV